MQATAALTIAAARTCARLCSVCLQASAASTPLRFTCCRKNSRWLSYSWKCCGVSTPRRSAGVELHLHQPADHRLRHELVPIDTAIDDEAAGDECRVASARAENLGVQWDFEGTRDFETIDGGSTWVGSFSDCAAECCIWKCVRG